MAAQWTVICKLKDIPPQGTRLVPRGLAWQELPGVVLQRDDGEQVRALLDGAHFNSAPRAYSVKVEDGRIYLDLAELHAPASRAEAALAGSFGVAARPAACG